MERIIIPLDAFKSNGNPSHSLMHNATGLVTFAHGLLNPLANGTCFALFFHKFSIGITIARARDMGPALHPGGAKMFELGKLELGRFNVPAEFMCPASTWEDWVSPLTKHITINHLCPGILVSRPANVDQRSVQVTMSIRNKGADNATISTNIAILRTDS